MTSSEKKIDYAAEKGNVKYYCFKILLYVHFCKILYVLFLLCVCKY